MLRFSTKQHKMPAFWHSIYLFFYLLRNATILFSHLYPSDDDQLSLYIQLKTYRGYDLHEKKNQQNINKPRKNLGQFYMSAYCLKWWFFYRIEFENGKSDRYILTTFHCSQMKSDYSTGSRFHCNNCCECNNCNRSHCVKVLFTPTFRHIIIQCM